MSPASVTKIAKSCIFECKLNGMPPNVNKMFSHVDYTAILFVSQPSNPVNQTNWLYWNHFQAKIHHHHHHRTQNAKYLCESQYDMLSSNKHSFLMNFSIVLFSVIVINLIAVENCRINNCHDKTHDVKVPWKRKRCMTKSESNDKNAHNSM